MRREWGQTSQLHKKRNGSQIDPGNNEPKDTGFISKFNWSENGKEDWLIYYWPPVCVRTCLRLPVRVRTQTGAGTHRQAKVGNSSSFVIASDRRECGNPYWSGQLANRVTGSKLIGITLIDRLYFL
jgi:hypothetical protein